MSDVETPPRPFKRRKVEYAELRQLPSDILLLSLPHLLAHPPTHKHHSRSNFLSLVALRKYLASSHLEANLECRAWTQLAEVGLRIGLDIPGIEEEVEKAVTKALIIANKHPSLRIYKPQITQLSARLAACQGNYKLAQNALKKVVNGSATSSDPPYVKYSTHLAFIRSLSKIDPSDDTDLSNARSLRSLGAIRDLYNMALRNKHDEVVIFAMVLELLDLVRHGVWNRVRESLGSLETALNIVFDLADAPKVSYTTTPPVVMGKSKIARVLIVHTLIIGALYYTYVGEADQCQRRLKKLHDMLDGGALDAFGPSGLVEMNLPNSPPLRVQITHPRIIFALGFLVSSASKRDPVGRKPKRKLFAAEGILVIDRELRKDAKLPTWSSFHDAEAHCRRLLQLKADMLSEVIGVCIMRSEVEEAKLKLSQLIADVRTAGLFSLYSARITLHQAHLAHSLGQKDRAIKCYQVAAFLSSKHFPTRLPASEEFGGCEDPWVNASARAGELWLKIGLAGELADGSEREREMEVLRKTGSDVIKDCTGLGGTLEAVGEVLAACLAKEFLVTKTHLRKALNLSTEAQDNHLRALVLSLVAAQYVHTSTEHAQAMLTTAEQLAAGLGAQPKCSKESDNKKPNICSPSNANGKVSGDSVGNAHLRLWIGERSLELKRRAGDEKGAASQMSANEKFKEAVTRGQKRKYKELQ